MPAVISRRGLYRRLFPEAEARWQRAMATDVLGGILTIEADLVQGPPCPNSRGALGHRVGLGCRQGDRPVWFLVHGNIRRRLFTIRRG